MKKSYFSYPGISIKPRSELSVFELKKRETIFASEIESLVVDKYSTSLDAIRQKSRKREHLEPRQVCMYFLKKHTETLTLSTIGDRFLKDHCTVIYACQAISNQIDTNKLFSENIKQIESDIISVKIKLCLL